MNVSALTRISIRMPKRNAANDEFWPWLPCRLRVVLPKGVTPAEWRGSPTAFTG